MPFYNIKILKGQTKGMISLKIPFILSGSSSSYSFFIILVVKNEAKSSNYINGGGIKNKPTLTRFLGHFLSLEITWTTIACNNLYFFVFISPWERFWRWDKKKSYKILIKTELLMKMWIFCIFLNVPWGLNKSL